MQAEYSDVPFDGPPKSYNSTKYDKRYIVIHNTSNDASRQDEANYAQTRSDGVSSHYYVDSGGIIQSLRTEYSANHVGSAVGNHHGVAYEITGTNDKSRDWWLSHVAWDVLAGQIARDCTRWSIEARTLSIAQMLDGQSSGIVTHDQARQAWGGTTHTDPGAGFPMDHLITLVKQNLEGDMTAAQQYVQHVMNYRLDAIIHNRSTNSVPAFTATDGSKYPAFSETNDLAAAIASLAAMGGGSGNPGGPALPMNIVLSGTVSGSASLTGTATPVVTE
jgi:N-acetyl-anhydromuramyl-L-alanine amidase AmpD